MTLLDDARTLAEREPLERLNGACLYCERFSYGGGHLPDCPWLAMPKIVAALKAAQALVDAHEVAGLWRVTDDLWELGDRQVAALTALWDLGIRPSGAEKRPS